MSSKFTRKDIDHYLYLLAKEYKKANRHAPDPEIILVGGSAILLNYNFRDLTTDIDCIMNHASSNIKDIINKISDEFGLDNGWLNDDFKKTTSYTPKLIEHSKFYKRFYNCLDVRTVSDEYVVAMKLCSGRDYKYDLSDVIGIIMEHSESRKELKQESVEKAYQELYNRELPEKAKTLLDSIYKCNDLADLYYSTMKTEQENKKILIDAEKKYGNALNKNNATDFIKSIKAKNKNNHTDRSLTVESDLTEIGVYVPKDEQLDTNILSGPLF